MSTKNHYYNASTFQFDINKLHFDYFRNKSTTYDHYMSFFLILPVHLYCILMF